MDTLLDKHVPAARCLRGDKQPEPGVSGELHNPLDCHAGMWSSSDYSTLFYVLCFYVFLSCMLWASGPEIKVILSYFNLSIRDSMPKPCRNAGTASETSCWILGGRRGG